MKKSNELNYYECYNILHKIQMNYCHLKGKWRQGKKKIVQKILAFISFLCKRFIDSTFGATKTLCSSSGQLNVICNVRNTLASCKTHVKVHQGYIIFGTKYQGQNNGHILYGYLNVV